MYQIVHYVFYYPNLSMSFSEIMILLNHLINQDIFYSTILNNI